MPALTWYGHAAFGVVDGDFRVLIDPWLSSPVAPEGAAATTVPNAILISHGHFDHVGDAVALLTANPECKAYVIHEVSMFLKAEGVPEAQIVGMNKGGTVDLSGGFSATMVDAVHSGDCGGGPPLACGGDAAGWILRAPSGLVMYHAGDTDCFGDMRDVIAAIDAPTLALLPIGGHYTMDAARAGYAVNNLLSSVTTVVPMHFGTFPILAGTPAQLTEAITREGVEVAEMAIGETREF